MSPGILFADVLKDVELRLGATIFQLYIVYSWSPTDRTCYPFIDHAQANRMPSQSSGSAMSLPTDNVLLLVLADDFATSDNQHIGVQSSTLVSTTCLYLSRCRIAR